MVPCLRWRGSTARTLRPTPSRWWGSRSCTGSDLARIWVTGPGDRGCREWGWLYRAGRGEGSPGPDCYRQGDCPGEVECYSYPSGLWELGVSLWDDAYCPV